jgi:putative DNA primase/helicase
MVDLLNIELFKEENINILQNEIITNLLNKENYKATESIADYIKHNYILKSMRDDVNSEIWIYEEGIYLPNGKSYIREICRQLLQDRVSTYFCNQVISKIEIDTFIDQNEFFNYQNEFPHLLPVKNGILNLNTKKVEKFTPRIPFFTKLNYEYREGAKCENIIKFIRSIVSNEKDFLTLQEISGFALLKDYTYEKGFMLYGEHGRNGKSKWLSLLQKLIGSANCSNVSLQNLETDQYSAQNLQNKLVNVAADLSNEAIKQTGMYKSLTGRDEVTVNRKNKSHISFTNYAKMIFACNELPMIHTFSQSFWMRWVVIDFPYRFLPKNELAQHKDNPYVFLQDSHIIEKISTDEEMEGFLSWAVEGYQRLKAKGFFSNETTASRVEKFWLRKANSAKAFIDDCLILDYDSEISKEEFRKEYHNYCIKHNIRQMSEKAINITLIKDLGISDKQVNTKDTRYRVWTGIKIKNNSPMVFSPDKLYSFICEHSKGVSYSGLSDVFENKLLDAQLKLLSQEGSIKELPKGLWSKV